MKKKRVWRYYCEFCKKSGCSAGHMKRHEIHCTNNPNRKCGMCSEAGLYQQPIEDLIKALGKGDKEGVDNLREKADGCPACMLAAIRQSKLQFYDVDEDGYHGFYVDSFDYKKEKEEFWSELNDERSQQAYYY